MTEISEIVLHQLVSQCAEHADPSHTTVADSHMACSSVGRVANWNRKLTILLASARFLVVCESHAVAKSALFEECVLGRLRNKQETK